MILETEGYVARWKIFIFRARESERGLGWLDLSYHHCHHTFPQDTEHVIR